VKFHDERDILCDSAQRRAPGLRHGHPVPAALYLMRQGDGAGFLAPLLARLAGWGPSPGSTGDIAGADNARRGSRSLRSSQKHGRGGSGLRHHPHGCFCLERQRQPHSRPTPAGCAPSWHSSVSAYAGRARHEGRPQTLRELRAAARLAAVVLTLVLLSCSSPRAAGPDDGAAIWPLRRTSEEWARDSFAPRGARRIRCRYGRRCRVSTHRSPVRRTRGTRASRRNRTSVRCGRATRRPIAEVTHHPNDHGAPHA
jgi:hypothetical protein